MEEEEKEKEEGGQEEYEEEEEARVPTILREPIKPSKKEVAEHMMSHMPYRSWCPYCVKGRGLNDPHKKQKSDERSAIPVISADYCNPDGRKTRRAEKDEDPNRKGEEEHKERREGGQMTVLVARDNLSGSTISMVVPRKGASHPWIPNELRRWIDGLGYSKVIVKSDQEPSIRDVWNQVKLLRNEDTVIEHSPVGESQSNGVAEKAIEEVEGMIRTMKSAVQGRIQREIQPGHPLMTWLVKYASEIMNRCKVMHDGRTAYERIKGRQASRAVCEFGEKVLCMPLKPGRGTKVEDKFIDGVFLGVNPRTNEVYVATEEGEVIRARTIKRRPFEDRWDVDIVLNVKGTPWAPGDGENVEPVPVARHAEEKPQEESPLPRGMAQETEQPRVRRVMLMRSDFERHGFTTGCYGCRGIQEGSHRSLNHTEACRERMTKLLCEEGGGSERVKRANERADEAIAREVEREDERSRRGREEQGNQEKKARVEEETSRSSSDSNNSSSSSRGDQGGAHAHGQGERVEAGRPASRPLDDQEADEGEAGGKRRRLLEDNVDDAMLTVSKEAWRKIKEEKQNAVMDFTSTTLGKPIWNFGLREHRCEARKLMGEKSPTVMLLQLEAEGQAMSRSHVKDHNRFCHELRREHQGSNMYVVYVKWGDAGGGAGEPSKVKVHGGYRLRVPVQGIDSVDTTLSLWTDAEEVSNKIHEKIEASRAGRSRLRMSEVCSSLKRGAAVQRFRDEVKAAHRDMLQDILLISSVVHDGGVNSECMQEEVHDYACEAWDDVKGGSLPAEEVLKARREEMGYIRSRGVYVKVPWSKAVQVTGKRPIKTRWVDTDKGCKDKAVYRSRIVAMEVKRYKDHELYAPMPPLEAIKIMVSRAANDMNNMVIKVLDIKRAYLYAPTRRPIFIEIPNEDKESGDEGKCAELKYSLYGTRDAARNWDQEMERFMISVGFQRGKASACIYKHTAKDLAVTIHGDDMVCVGGDRDTEWLHRETAKKYEVKAQTMGMKKGMDKEAKVLNRTLRWSDEGISIEADPRHAREIIKHSGVEQCTPLVTPCTKEDEFTEEEVDLDPALCTKYRAISARINYLSQDRPDLKFPAKELSQGMSRPTTKDWAKMIRVSRYILGRKRAVCTFKPQQSMNVHAYSDSDWAGDKKTRRSTSGGCVYVGGHLVKQWSSVQQVTALSSAEAELHAAVKAACEAIGMKDLIRDIGGDPTVSLSIDASATLSMIAREGLGKAKHIGTQWMWMQEAARNKTVTFHKVGTAENPADLFTKPLPFDKIRNCMKLLGFHFASDD